MMKKLIFVAAFAAGYVLGAQAGRERYEEIKSGARKVWSDPRVQDAAERATDAVTETIKEQAPVATEKVKDVASSVAGSSNQPAKDETQQPATQQPEASVDTTTISPSLERRNSLEKQLQNRPDVQDLKNRHILLDTNAAPSVCPHGSPWLARASLLTFFVAVPCSRLNINSRGRESQTV